MMSYWVLFIGIAVVSWLVQMNLQNKLLQDPYRQWHDRTRRGFEDVA